MSEQFDFIVIGGGSAGYAAAALAARLGMSTAVVDGGAEIGGLCILRGCMPSKTLLESAVRADSIRRAAEFGLRGAYQGADPAAILARKRRLVGEFAEYRREQLQKGAFTFVRGIARFVDPHVIEVSSPGGERQLLTGRTFLIATGSRVNRLPIPGLAEAGAWDSDEVLEADNVPASVVVLGGGAIGLEFASYYAGIGSEVTVLQRGPQLLKEVDLDMATALAEALEKRGVRVWRKTALVGVAEGNGRKRVIFDHEQGRQVVEAEQIIYALGRAPEMGGLELERAGVATTSAGIEAAVTQQTNVPHIFAAGDVCGPFQVVHIAIQQGEIAARNAASLVRGDHKPLEAIDYRLKVFVVFTHPEAATVGRTEWEATAEGADFLTARSRFDDHGKSLIRGETDGFVKLIVERASRRIIGAAALGPEAGELIHEISVAMYFQATANDLARVPHYHPTLSEIWTYPAEELSA